MRSPLHHERAAPTRHPDALRELVDRYGDHPLATYARLAVGANAGRHFPRLDGGRVVAREPGIKESLEQLGAAVNASMGDAGLDNITLNRTMRRLATVHGKDGNLAEAEVVLDCVTSVFAAKGLPDHLQATIAAQAEETRARIRDALG